MLKHLIQFICVIIIFLYVKQISAEQLDITVKELVLGDKKEFHLRILKSIPKGG